MGEFGQRKSGSMWGPACEEECKTMKVLALVLAHLGHVFGPSFVFSPAVEIIQRRDVDLVFWANFWYPICGRCMKTCTDEESDPHWFLCCCLVFKCP